MPIHARVPALLGALLASACDGSSEEWAPTVADLTGAVALVQLEGDPVLYRQLADDSLEPVLPDEARLMAFTTTDTHAYVQLSEPSWLRGDADGQWCTLLDIPLDEGDTVSPRCIARTLEADPDEPPASGELPVEVSAYDDTEVWVLWQVTHAENDVDQELWGYREGVGAHAATLDVVETSFAVEGGFVHGRDLWTLDGGPASTPLEAEPSRARWGPYQLTDVPYRLFRASEGFVDLPGVMGGDPYCATYLSESSPHTFSDGPNLVLHVGTQWDDDPDVPLTYCSCTLDWDCQLVSEDEDATLREVPAWNDIVGPRFTDGLAYVAWNDELYFVHDLQVSSDLGGSHEPDRFHQWGHDLYFTEDPGPRLFRVDWAGDDAAVTELPAYAGLFVVQLVRL